MQDKYRLYRRSNRAQGTFYAQNCETGARESLGTKSRSEALKLIRAKNETLAQPALNREMAKVYLRAQDPEFCSRTWQDVADLIDAAYEGSTKKRFAKFLKSAPMGLLRKIKLVDTTADDMLTVLTHERAGVSTNVQLRILHNRALDLGWLLYRALSRKAWPPLKYRKRRAITLEQHQKILAVTKREDFRYFLELLWETGGSQTDIASLIADDVDWPNRRLFYERVKLEHRDQGGACIAIGSKLEAVLKQPNAVLGVIVGTKPLPRSAMTKKLWDYIKKNNLQDPKKRTMINADPALKAVFGGKKQVSMFEMTKLVSAHVK